ncbi:5-hydroxytryptamine receptor 1A-like [Glandiceps talaboti]
MEYSNTTVVENALLNVTEVPPSTDGISVTISNWDSTSTNNFRLWDDYLFTRNTTNSLSWAGSRLIPTDLSTVLYNTTDTFRPTGPSTANDQISSQSNTTTDFVAKDDVTSILLLTFCVIICLSTTLGNSLVIVSVRIERRLRTPHNLLTISLAVADLVVGIFVMPCFTIYIYMGRWPLGSLLCDIWITLDFMCCTASILNLCAISLDRYWAVSRPLQCLKSRSKRRSMIMITVVWMSAVVCWVPAIVAWRIISGDSGPSECLYLPHPTYVLASTVFIYYIPIISMVIIYLMVCKSLQKQFVNNKTLMANPEINRSLEQVQETCPKNNPNAKDRSTAHGQMEPVASIGDGTIRGYLTIHARGKYTVQQMNTEMSTSPNRFFGAAKQNTVKTLGVHSTSSLNLVVNTSNSPNTGSDTNAKYGFDNPAVDNTDVEVGMEELDKTTKTQPKKETSFISDRKLQTYGEKMEKSRHLLLTRKRLAMHRRTTNTLGLLIVVFLACWLWFVILFPIQAYCNCVPFKLYDASYWLAYINSAMNPFLYVIVNKDFRRAFKKVICFLRSDTERDNDDLANYSSPHQNTSGMIQTNLQ